MKLMLECDLGFAKVERAIYDDENRISQFFLPFIWIDFFSRKRRFILKTVAGDIVKVTPEVLKRMDLKLLRNIFECSAPTYMFINKPHRAGKRIPLLAMSKRLNKLWRGKIDVRREYKERKARGYKYWSGPEFGRT